MKKINATEVHESCDCLIEYAKELQSGRRVSNTKREVRFDKQKALWLNEPLVKVLDLLTARAKTTGELAVFELPNDLIRQLIVREFLAHSSYFEGSSQSN